MVNGRFLKRAFNYFISFMAGIAITVAVINCQTAGHNSVVADNSDSKSEALSSEENDQSEFYLICNNGEISTVVEKGSGIMYDWNTTTGSFIMEANDDGSPKVYKGHIYSEQRCDPLYQNVPKH